MVLETPGKYNTSRLEHLTWQQSRYRLAGVIRWSVVWCIMYCAGPLTTPSTFLLGGLYCVCWPNIWMWVVTEKRKSRKWGDLWTLSGNLPLKSIIGGVQWVQGLNPLATKWPTVYLRGQIGQTVSNYPSIEGEDFLFLLFSPPFHSCVCQRAASFQLTNQRSPLT